MVFPPRFVSVDQAKVDLPNGGFRIVSEGHGTPRIEASNAAGEAYGRDQLENLRKSGRLPEGPYRIEEIPLFEERGFMLDISRCRVPGMSFLFRLVERLRRLRYNQLQLYTEHTFAYRNHEVVWKDASPLTAEEVTALDAHCRENHIELVPNQNCFGHMERWLRHPAYKHLAESPDGFVHPLIGPRPHGTTLFPSDESAVFVREILAELVPHFSSRKLNVGGDEPWELGQGRSRERVAEFGKAEVYREFLERILRIAADLGREPIFWADIVLEHPELVPLIPKEAIPAIWGYDADHPFAEQCALVSDAGFTGRFQVVPGTGSWNSWTGRLDDARENIRRAAGAGTRHRARGLVLTCWGDGGHQQPHATMYPGLVLAARESWAGNCDSTEGLAEAIDDVFYPDSCCKNGEALLAMGRIDGILKSGHPNRSFTHRVFFAEEDALAELAKMNAPEDIAKARRILGAIESPGLDPNLIFARDASLWALDWLQETADREDLRARLEDLKKSFTALWLSESRRGGLAESLSSFPQAGAR